MNTVRAIVIHPDDSGDIHDIEQTATAFQRIVGGPLMIINFRQANKPFATIWYNPEAMQRNLLAGRVWQSIMRFGPHPRRLNGTVIITGAGEMGNIEPIPNLIVSATRQVFKSFRQE